MMPMLSEILAEYERQLTQPRRRYPNIRSGEREPIPSIVRLSVYRRDGFHCRECGNLGADGDGLELDHMLPWSAGGGDHSANLRTLCAPCNQERSNWNDGADDSRLCPTTWWCFECWRHPGLDNPEPEYLDAPTPQRRFRPLWRNGVNLNRAPFVTDPHTQVYCAWCWGYGWTNVLFSESRQTQLATLCTPEPRTEPTPTPRRNPPSETEETSA